MAVARATVTKQQLDLDRGVVAVLAEWFGSASRGSFPIDLLTGLGVEEAAARRVAAMTADVPVVGRTAGGSPMFVRGMSAVERVASDEPSMRARYVVNAAWRLSVAEDFVSAVSNERRYLESHVAAAVNRRAAAERLDRFGNRVLRWVTAGDELVNPACKLLEGRLFTARNLPDGLIPGGVRVGCRCRAEPWGHAFWAISEF